VLISCNQIYQSHSLKDISVPLFTVLKNTAIVFIALGEKYMYNQQLNLKTIICFLLIILGSAVAAIGEEIYLTMWGAFWTFANIASTVCYMVSSVSRGGVI
jgi:hypothetical protein